MVNETGKTGALAGRLPLAVAIIALAVALFAAISVQPAQTAGASAQQIAAGTTAAPNDAFDRAMQAGRITACYVVWPPSVIKDPNSGNLSGFVIDMFSNMASSANLNVTYVESTFGGFPADLNTGKCDVVVAGIYPLISRSTSVAFTNPFLFSGNSMVVRAGDDRFNTTDSFNQKGVRIAVVSGEFGDLYAEKYFPNADLVVLDASSDPSMPLAAVSSGQADVGISEADVVGQYAAWWANTPPYTRR
jgi:ABC-type amino acid transport substrate-binding protein